MVYYAEQRQLVVAGHQSVARAVRCATSANPAVSLLISSVLTVSHHVKGNVLIPRPLGLQVL